MRPVEVIIAATATFTTTAQAHADTFVGATVGGAVFDNSASESGTTAADTSAGGIVALRAGFSLGRHIALVAEGCLLVGPNVMLTLAPLLEIRLTNWIWLRGGPGFGVAEGAIGADGGYGALGAVGVSIKRWGRHSVGIELRVSRFSGEVTFGDVGLGATWRFP